MKVNFIKQTQDQAVQTEVKSHLLAWSVCSAEKEPAKSGLCWFAGLSWTPS